jgi:hypothetical protein
VLTALHTGRERAEHIRPPSAIEAKSQAAAAAAAGAAAGVGAGAAAARASAVAGAAGVEAEHVHWRMQEALAEREAAQERAEEEQGGDGESVWSQYVHDPNVPCPGVHE